MAQIVFLTLYLGLIAGRQPIELQADGAVASMRVMLDGKTIETMLRPPWKTIVDFGSALQPREIVAVGFDANGNEIARASQILNVPRRAAELEIVLHRDGSGRLVSATLSGKHLSYAKPKRAALKLDDVPLPLDRRYSADIPVTDLKRPHVLAAEMRFEDGAVARREIVYGGQFGDSAAAQLSAVAVARTGHSDAPPADGCVVSNGTALHVTAVEKSPPFVVIVSDPDPTETRGKLMAKGVIGGSIDTTVVRHAAAMENGASLELLSPVGDRVVVPEQPTAVLFPPSPIIDASHGGIFWLLGSARRKGGNPAGPRQWADAVAVAGVNAVATGRRRAVILVIGSAGDASRYSAAGVRRYLDALGVPLFVWSVYGPRPELTAQWGEVEDVSTMEKMEAAAEKIRTVLDAQRIAWIESDPLTALHATVKPECGYAAIAH